MANPLKGDMMELRLQQMLWIRPRTSKLAGRGTERAWRRRLLRNENLLRP